MQVLNSIIGRNPLKLAVVGSRSCTDELLVFEYLSILSTPWENPNCPDEFNMEIVSGGAKGADTIAESFAKVCRIPTKIFLPDWDKHGKAAGFIRNREIVDYCDMVIAFWDQKSKGTKNTIDTALKAGKPVWIIPV
jgi:predicted Rossmann fold nucleotide-binding protein DprA/Smf involved in DNA uptake